MNSVWNFVLWNEFSLKFCALKWFRSEILCPEMISVWNFVLWNEFSLKFCALKWFQSEILFSEMNSVWNFVLWNFLLWTEIFLSLSAIVRRSSSLRNDMHALCVHRWHKWHSKLPSVASLWQVLYGCKLFCFTRFVLFYTFHPLLLQLSNYTNNVEWTNFWG